MKKTPAKTLVLLDSHAILHRAYHALPDFASSKGEPTGALYGLVAMIMKAIEDLKPDYVVACYDLPKPTYRHEAYKEYKAGRKKADPELVAQMKSSRKVFEAFSIPIYDKEGFEADDMLGTIVEQMKDDPNLDIIITSGDMDTLQLVNDKKVRVYTLKKGIKDTIMYDEDAVRARFGFGPLLLPDYKGLRGDPSDNIIGIKGIGEKTGSTIIQTFGTIEEMYALMKKQPEKFAKLVEKAKLTPRIVELLRAGEEEAEFSKMLATIRRDAPITFTLPEKSWKETVDIGAVEKLFKELEFRTLGVRVKEILGKTDAFGDPISKEGSVKGDRAEGESTEEGADGGLLSSAAPLAQTIDPRELQETAIALWVVDSNLTNPGLEEILLYADTQSFPEAKEKIFAEIEKRGLGKVLRDIEFPLISLIERMRDHGIKIDKEYLKKLSTDYHKKQDAIVKKIWKYAGEEFNINSPKQLGVILFDKLHITLKNQKKTEGGARSTRESELEKMKEMHPIIPEILEYREVQKLLSTYIDTIPELIGEDGRLHSQLIQTGSTTGRMASQNPNLQNIPIKTEAGRAIRNAFVADKGKTILSLDYSQMELRIAAFLSKDKNLIDIFKSGRDVHTEVASRVFKVKAEEVDKEMRRKAKVINFGILYGMGVNALRQNLGGTRAEAQMFYDEYFATFTGLAEYLEHVKADAARKGYTETFFGRRRYFEGIKSKLPFVRAMAERMAINAPIQGTQADIVKIAMARVDDFLTKENLSEKAALVLQIHDELMLEVDEGIAEKLAHDIQTIMQDIIPLEQTQGIVMAANAALGKNWGDMKDYL